MSSVESVERLEPGSPIDELGAPARAGGKPPLGRRTVAYVGLAALSIVCVLPFVWMLATSLKTVDEVIREPHRLVPSDPQFANYSSLWRDFPMSAWIWNSFKISGLVTLGVVATSALAAYAFARIEFPGRNIVFLAFLATLMIPGMVYQVPKFAMIQEFGWQNSHTALIVPALSSAFGVFLLRQFFLTLPKELEEAARMDGAGHLRIFTRIILPLSGPALATLAVFTFIGTWNDFLNPLLFIDDYEKYTLQIGLTFLNEQHRSVVNFNRLMAGDVIALVPMIAVFIVAQRYYVRGIALTGIK
jgi:multiple sugar transport system permease protein